MSLFESTESAVNFQKYWLILKRRWWQTSAVFAAVFTLSSVWFLLQKPSYVAEGKLLFKRTSTAPSIYDSGKEIAELYALQELSNPIDTEAEVIRSTPILKKVLSRLQLKDEKGELVHPQDFLGQIKVSSIKGTNILQVSYKDNDPERAAEVVNTLMAVYLENNLLTNRAEAMSAREFLQKQLPEAEANVRQVESTLRRFKEANKVVAIDEEAKSAVSIVTDMQKQINTLETELADAKSRSAVLKKQLGSSLKDAGTITSISQFPAIQDLLKEVQQVEAQLAVERSRFQEEFPSVLALQRKKASLDKLLQQRLKQAFGNQNQSINSSLQNSGFDQKLTEEFLVAEARRLGLASQLAALTQVQNNYSQRLNAIPQLEQRLRELERQLQTSQSTYLLLLQKFQELRITENQNLGNARVVAAAMVPDQPVASRKMALIAGFLLATVAAIATVYILEITDRNIKSVEEARKIFGFSILGLIPTQKTEKISLRSKNLERSTPEILVRESSRSALSQAYRMLQANLKFLNSDRELKTIVVTSSIPKEGKSTVAANLAVAIAQLGRKVLLVDADMHRPLQHNIWELPNHLGLSNIIVGQTEPKTAIKKITANLHVLTSGVIPPNPMALLDSQRMASLIGVFAANYDYTIIDSPALNVTADAAILGQMANGILMVVRPGVVDANSAAQAKEFIEKSNQRVLGLVVNGFVPENEPYSYYFSSKYPDDAELAKEEDLISLTTTRNR